jgi:hypothetical protein
MSKKATRKEFDQLHDWVDALNAHVAQLLVRVGVLERHAKSREEYLKAIEDALREMRSLKAMVQRLEGKGKHIGTRVVS